MPELLVEITYALFVYWAIVLVMAHCARYIQVTSYADQGCMEPSQHILYGLARGGVVVTSFIAFTMTFQAMLLLMGIATTALFFM